MEQVARIAKWTAWVVGALLLLDGLSFMDTDVGWFLPTVAWLTLALSVTAIGLGLAGLAVLFRDAGR
jgi:ABC-type polysaccharide/polyol phosphate export permease